MKYRYTSALRCRECQIDDIPRIDCYPVAFCGCYICEDIVATEEGYPTYSRPDEFKEATFLK